MTTSVQKTEAAATGLLWFRGGLRLEDNACVFNALQENTRVACLYTLDDNYLRGQDIGAARVQFLLESLHELRDAIHSYDGKFLVRLTDDPANEVVKVAKEAGAGRIYANRDYLPYPIQRDNKVRELAQAEGIEFKLYDDVLLVNPDLVRTEEGKPYTVHTPYHRRWESKLKTPARYDIAPVLDHLKFDAPVASAALPTLQEYGLTLRQQIEPGGEKRAYMRLKEFVAKGLAQYHQNRNDAHDPNSTSRLSMHLKWGTVSVRDCYRAARELGGPGPDKWIDELSWREFFYGIVLYFPHVMNGPMLPEYSSFPWSDQTEHFEAWKAGMTGYPFVDAGMRQMNATGWMHNRLRQVVASYLCKDLVINWQEGEKYFMQQLTCGDWPANNGGWQWVAGTGTDPRRATRLFNPTLQMEKYDPQAQYVKQWVPEYGTYKYPQPIVTHEVGRARFLEAFASTAPSREAIRATRREEQQEAKRSAKRVQSKQPELF